MTTTASVTPQQTIRISNVCKSYGDYQVLKNIDAEVARGEVVVICGPSGSGKSTLIRTVNRLEEINSGSITLDGRDIHAATRTRELNLLRSRIGFVFQSFNLFPHLSVVENVTISPIRVKGVSPDIAQQKALALLERVGLAEKAGAYPGQLSGGQQQRVAIARALANDPRIILADEPTAALDSQRAGAVMDLLRKVATERRAAVIVVTHDEKIFDRFDHIYSLRDGQLEQSSRAKLEAISW